MAGAGYKLFNTGDVLTAAQVNTYLMEQTVMVFADAAARTAALSGVVSEGMISYLKDTNAVEVYNGSAWVASDDPNAIQNTIVDAKGDLIAATANDTPARLAVGNNGETLVADSSASTGLRWQSNFAAGKNKIINGDFSIWQRGTSFTNFNGSFLSDRWRIDVGGGIPTGTISQQTFTPGTAPVSGYEGTYFMRTNYTALNSATVIELSQKIEDVRTFANQTVTLSFWAKADASRTMPAIFLRQNFGSGGSSNADTSSNTASLTTSWQRFSYTYSVPSVSGKTIGTGSSLDVRFDLPITAGSTVDIWGVQLEAGNVATAFQTATGTLAGELAACQRYYWRSNTGQNSSITASGGAYSTTGGIVSVKLPVTMRIKPQTLEYANQAIYDYATTIALTNLTIATNETTTDQAALTFTVASGTAQFRPILLIANANTSGYVAVSAEL